MTAPSNEQRELRELIAALREESLSAEQAARLNAALSGSASARELFARYALLQASLELAGSAALPCSANDLEQGETVGRLPVVDSSLPERPYVIVQSDADSVPSSFSFQSFIDTPLFSYLVSAAVVCAMLFGAWACKISYYRQIVHRSLPPSSAPGRELVFVGRITGMKDCRWADPRTETYVGASVPLSRKYALAAGLMEITYKSGAKVILEGPCTYTVEARAGGFLSLGKLTATVVSGQWPVASAKPQAANPKSPNLQISKSPNHYPLSTIHYPLFAVRTPTAIVTDLGTEFGVEVSAEGNTTSHVFRGSVRVRVVGEGLKDAVVLRENESARVVKGKEGSPRLVKPDEVGSPPKFVRRLHEPPKLLDLLDIVAGGNGTGRRRERGIDPATGKQDTWLLYNERQDDHGYHPVAWHPLIDGVFIPHVPTSVPPAPQDVQLDSAGKTFDRFLEARVVGDIKTYHCTIQGYTAGGIWARAADVKSPGATNGDGWMYSLVRDEQYMPEGRGLLGLHANVGITFDLAAMRKMYEGVRPALLRATAGMGDGPRRHPDAFGMADLWIFVDGRLKWVRKDIRHQDGAIKVDVPLGPKDRFLTIVSTNGQRGKAYDWIVLGDPVLETTPVEAK